MSISEKLKAAETLAAEKKIEHDAQALASFRQFRELKKTNPHAAAMLINADPHGVQRGRELNAEIEAETQKTATVITIDERVAALLAKTPPPGSTTPPPAAPPPAA